MRELHFQSTGQELRWLFRIGGRTVELTPNAGIVTDFSDAVAAILVAGGGIGISPTYIAAPYAERGDLVLVLHAFLAFLGEAFPSPAPWDRVIASLVAREEPCAE